MSYSEPLPDEERDEGSGFNIEHWQYRRIRMPVGKRCEKDATRPHRSKRGKQIIHSNTSGTGFLLFGVATSRAY